MPMSCAPEIPDACSVFGHEIMPKKVGRKAGGLLNVGDIERKVPKPLVAKRQNHADICSN